MRGQHQDLGPGVCDPDTSGWWPSAALQCPVVPAVTEAYDSQAGCTEGGDPVSRALMDEEEFVE